MSACHVYWDAADAQNSGWTYRYTDWRGTEQRGALDSEDPDADLLALAREARQLSDDFGEVIVFSRATELPALRYQGPESYRWVR